MRYSHLYGKMYALKMVQLKNLSDKEKENAINEVRILASIIHPNIISYKVRNTNKGFAKAQNELIRNIKTPYFFFYSS